MQFSSAPLFVLGVQLLCFVAIAELLPYSVLNHVLVVNL